MRARAGRSGLEIAEAIDGLTRARPRTGPRISGGRREPATAFLRPVLGLGGPATADLVGSVGALSDRLIWRRPAASELGWAVAGKVAWAEIVGPTAPVPCDRLRIGLHLQGPRTLYPWHVHRAAELYLTLAGAAWWGRGGAIEGKPEGPGALRRHASEEAHAIETRPQPLLALYVWRGAGCAAGAEGYRLVDPEDATGG
ncbi:MAG: dimethylsulfonioproprionate lyase family protein [Marivibrio sp.]|uniref:dimethylsulfonioproprionate lyase family protein n=1 Tax=Marivibrio sp. TaxID=2039719 RepID=UPI0032EB9CC4